MFWRVAGLATASPVEGILDKESYTLEELLDEDDLIQELKSLNSRLVGFLKGKEQVQKLISYVVENAPADADDKRMFKYPFISCEIFTCEIEQILTAVADDEEIMNLLFSFADPDRIHSNLLAGYFSKVVVCLLLRKTPSVMLYLQSHQELLGKLTNLIGITSIMEVMMKLVGADDQIMMYHSDKIQWLAQTNLLDSLLEKLNPENSSDVHSNTAETLSAIARTTPAALATKLGSPQYIAKLFQHVLEGPESMTSVIHSLSVCVTLLDPKRTVVRGQPLAVQQQQQQQQQQQLTAVETIEGMLQRLGDLLLLLKVSGDSRLLPTPYGLLSPPLGIHRLKIVEFIGVLLGTNSEAVRLELVRLGGIQTCLDLFFRFHFNNFLHHQVERMINACLESGSPPLIDHLFTQCTILSRILNAYADPYAPDTRPEKEIQKPRTHSGFMGHLTRIANKINHVATTNSQVDAHMQANERWVEWRQTDLKRQNAVENVYQWSCGRPAALDDRPGDSDDDDFSRERDYDIASISLSGNSPRPSHRYGENLLDSEDIEEGTDIMDSYEVGKAEAEMDHLRINASTSRISSSEGDSSGAGYEGQSSADLADTDVTDVPLSEYSPPAMAAKGETSSGALDVEGGGRRWSVEDEDEKEEDKGEVEKSEADSGGTFVLTIPASQSEASSSEPSSIFASSEALRTAWVAFQDQQPADTDPSSPTTSQALSPTKTTPLGSDIPTRQEEPSSIPEGVVPVPDSLKTDHLLSSSPQATNEVIEFVGTPSGPAQGSGEYLKVDEQMKVPGDLAISKGQQLVEDLFATSPPIFHAVLGVPGKIEEKEEEVKAPISVGSPPKQEKVASLPSVVEEADSLQNEVGGGNGERVEEEKKAHAVLADVDEDVGDKATRNIEGLESVDKSGKEVAA